MVTGVYAGHAQLYREGGWQGVLPVTGKGVNLPSGFTGRSGAWPDDAQVRAWIESRGTDNIALRLPDDVIGIDVDAYDGRHGDETLTEFENQYGPLPPTWYSTSRTDGSGSGIYLYRVPPNIEWVSDLGRDSDIQIIRYAHRYAVVWPSIHPGTQRPYTWHTPGHQPADRIPKLTELTLLSPSWVGALRKTSARPRTRVGAGGGDEPNPTWNGERVDPARVLEGLPIGEQDDGLFKYLCSLRRRNATREEMIGLGMLAVQAMENEPGKDPWSMDVMVEKVDRIIADYPAGSPAQGSEVVTPEQLAWAKSVTDAATGERNVEAAEPPPIEPQDNDTGNGLRFVRVLRDRVRFLHGEDRWLVWDGCRWRRDDTKLALELTKTVIADIRAQAALLEGDENGAERRRWMRWAHKSESIAGRRAMLSCAEAETGVKVRPDDVDAQSWLLNCQNGTVDLRTGELRPWDANDLLSRVASVDYEPGAESDLLDEFLETFIPEPHLAEYVFRALGSTLMGGNAFRLLLIVHGGTTSGKSQLMEGIAQTLGDYAVPIGTSVFRGNQDDKPRPDLLRALPARLAYAEEAGQAWELHADMVKRMTGGAKVSMRAMRSNDMVEATPSFTPAIVTNEMPRLKGADPAVRRRLLTLRLGHSLLPGTENVDKKREFIEDPATRRALLARLVAGCIKAHTVGLADIPAEFALATMESFDELTHVNEFITYMKEEGRLVEDDTTPLSSCWKASDLHAEYMMWVRMCGTAEDVRTRVSRTEFGKSLKASQWATRPSAGTRWVGKRRVDSYES